MARAPVSKTGGWGFESLHSCQGQVRSPCSAREASQQVSRRPSIRGRVTSPKRLSRQPNSGLA